jgi:hypothetical protein
MLRTLICVVAVLGSAPSFQAEELAPAKSTPLANAVEEFNQRANNDDIGKWQEPLTVEEVIAAIRLWDRKQTPASDQVYDTCQEIAESRLLPENEVRLLDWDKNKAVRF